MNTNTPPFPAIESWLNFIEKCELRLHSMSDVEVAEHNQVEFQTIYGICAQAIRYAGAYVALSRIGRSREAVALARQALEHALTAQWAHFDEDGLSKLYEGYVHTFVRSTKAVRDFLVIPEENLGCGPQSLSGEGKRMLRITEMIEQIDSDKLFATAYLQQSQIVHVTSETVTAFLRVGEEEQLSILSEATDPNEDQTAHFVAIAAMFATWLLKILKVNPSGLAELDELSDKLRLPLNVRD